MVAPEIPPQNPSSVVWLFSFFIPPCMLQLHHLSDRMATGSLTPAYWWCLATPGWLYHSYPVPHGQQCRGPPGMKHFISLLRYSWWEFLMTRKETQSPSHSWVPLVSGRSSSCFSFCITGIEGISFEQFWEHSQA